MAWPEKPRVTPLLLPKGVRSPWVILLLWGLPQTVLLALNLQAWDLAVGEMSADQKASAYAIFGLELLALAGGVGVSAWLWVRRETFSRLAGLIPLILSILFLATVLVKMQSVIPAALTDWMLPPDQWMLKQFALMMPAALFGALRMLCPDREAEGERGERLAVAISVSVGLVAGSLGFLFLAGFVGSFIAQFIDSMGLLAFQIGPFAVISVYLGLSILAAASVLRVCISVYIWARICSPVGLGILTAVIALVAPLAGLALNAKIPFPADFQMPSIYLLTIVNAGILLLPNFSHPLLHRVVWLAQCAMFSFSAYFFAVFLPFLPLTPISLLMFALGLLMYVPSLLFLLHGYRILDGFRAEIRDGGKWLPALLGLAAVLAWPVGYTIQARWDRATLYQALDYLQYPDYSRNARFAGDLGALHSSLIHLRDFKQGYYLPYLSEYYNWLAFDNLTLPQAKLDGLATAFFGQPLPKLKTNQNFDVFP